MTLFVSYNRQERENCANAWLLKQGRWDLIGCNHPQAPFDQFVIFVGHKCNIPNVTSTPWRYASVSVQAVAYHSFSLVWTTFRGCKMNGWRPWPELAERRISFPLKPYGWFVKDTGAARSVDIVLWCIGEFCQQLSLGSCASLRVVEESLVNTTILSSLSSGERTMALEDLCDRQKEKSVIKNWR